jgi:hypothetical protein
LFLARSWFKPLDGMRERALVGEDPGDAVGQRHDRSAG